MRRILLVDDHADTLELMAELLQERGHAVSAHGDAASALDGVSAFGPEVVAIDIELPGMNGFELMRELRQIPRPGLKRIVVLTGHASGAMKRRALDAGADLFLAKPVSFDVLLAALEED